MTDDGLGDDPLREKLIGTEVIKRGRILEFRIDTVEAADGHRSTRDIAGHPGGVCVVAIDAEDRVLLVRQWRHATGGALLEIPAGTLDRQDDGSIEDHAGAAARELEEETGSIAGSWRYLGAFYTAPGFTSELMHLYLATDLRAGRRGRARAGRGRAPRAPADPVRRGDRDGRARRAPRREVADRPVLGRPTARPGLGRVGRGRSADSRVDRSRARR